MVTVPEVGVGAVVSVMVGASGPGLPSVGVVSVAVPLKAVPGATLSIASPAALRPPLKEMVPAPVV